MDDDNKCKLTGVELWITDEDELAQHADVRDANSHPISNT